MEACTVSLKATMCHGLRQSVAMSQLRHAYACAKSSAQLGKHGLPGKNRLREITKTSQVFAPVTVMPEVRETAKVSTPPRDGSRTKSNRHAGALRHGSV